MPVPKQKNSRAARVRPSKPDGKEHGTRESVARVASDTPPKSPDGKKEFSLQTALEYLREGDVFVVHSIDRLTQNIEDLRKAVLAMSGRGILVEFINELLTTTAADKATSQLLVKAIGAVAEFQQALIREKSNEALLVAGKGAGRKGRKKALTPDRVMELRKRAAAGEKKAVLAREFGISRETLYQYLAAL